MNSIACQQAKEHIDTKRHIYLLLVSEECPFCQEVLDAIHNGKLRLSHSTMVLNTDSCSDEIDKIVSWPATPMIVHFRDGQEVNRGVGVEGIMAFGEDPVGNAPSEGEEVDERS
ncbi:MAG: hypothetical protein AMS21_00820 [Gemmatimonas sp. SG8_38_2]|nr:MAG: hypothetical protein AMS21_00820 [Gemmatimonas sp. SG8_38_2]